MVYRKTIVEKQQLSDETAHNQPIKGKYLKVNKNGIAEGNRFFINFLEDKNGTITSGKQVSNMIKKYIDNEFFYKKKEGYKSLALYKEMIIVHLRFLPPKISLIDAKYTLMDQFANFGGKFGIFAQLTGCSFLGLLNIIFLIIKNFSKRD